MRFMVLALDYDGTIAVEGRFEPSVRAAIERARDRGIVIILVTGRILSELQRVAGDLTCFDAVVAENGSVLTIPKSHARVSLGHAPPPALLQNLAERGVDAIAGACVVEADSTTAGQVIAAIHELELPLVVLFNRDRLMILPQGISKATGLHAALRLLRLSEHNAIGIGDGENDHALLEFCEIGVTVEWGSLTLRAVADAVISGQGPAAVAGFIDGISAQVRLPLISRGQSTTSWRHKVILGHDATGQEVSLPIQGHNVLVVGDSGSGKSWVAGLLSEQLVAQGYSVCFIDSEGDHGALATLPGVVTLGGTTTPPSMDEVALALRHPDLSVLVDLSKVELAEKIPYVMALLPRLAGLRRRTGLPHRIILDEAHYYLGDERASHLLDTEIDGYTLITYHPGDLDPTVRPLTINVISTRLSSPDDVAILHRMAGGSGSVAEWEETLGRLVLGEAALQTPFSRHGRGGPRPFTLASRQTAHVRHRAKYLDVPVPPWEAFVFTQEGQGTGQSVRTLRELAGLVPSTPPAVLLGHLQRGDLSRWIADVFGDHTLADQVRSLERIHAYEALTDVRAAIGQLIANRYIFQETTS